MGDFDVQNCARGILGYSNYGHATAITTFTQKN